MSKNISFYLIPKNDVTYVSTESSVKKALEVIHKGGFQAIPVLDQDGKYAGTITEGDFLWNLFERYDVDLQTMERERVSDLYLRWDYQAVKADANILELDHYILNQNYVPVVDDRDVFIGIVTRREIFKEIIRDRDAGRQE